MYQTPRVSRPFWWPNFVMKNSCRGIVSTTQIYCWNIVSIGQNLHTVTNIVQKNHTRVYIYIGIPIYRKMPSAEKTVICYTCPHNKLKIIRFTPIVFLIFFHHRRTSLRTTQSLNLVITIKFWASKLFSLWMVNTRFFIVIYPYKWRIDLYSLCNK